MEWTKNQKAAKVMRDYFGEPPSYRGGGQFMTWAETLADYIEANPPPSPEVGHTYVLADGPDGQELGTCVGPVPDDREGVWVFQISDTSGIDYKEHELDSILDLYDIKDPWTPRPPDPIVSFAQAESIIQEGYAPVVPDRLPPDAIVTQDLDGPPHPPIEWAQTQEMGPEELNAAHDSLGDTPEEVQK